MYKKYIDTNKISISRHPNGHKCIDTSEIIRLFPNAKLEQVAVQTEQQENEQVEQAFTPKNTQPLQPDIALLLENERLKVELELQKKLNERTEQDLKESKQEAASLRDDATSRETWYRQQLEHHQREIKLLTDQSVKKAKKSWWRGWWK